MYVNFQNLLFGESAEVANGEIDRESGNLFAELTGVYIVPTKFKKLDGWIVKVSMEQNVPDPKIHFLKESDAMKFYQILVDGLKNKIEFMDVDVLEHGAF